MEIEFEHFFRTIAIDSQVTASKRKDIAKCFLNICTTFSNADRRRRGKIEEKKLFQFSSISQMYVRKKSRSVLSENRLGNKFNLVLYGNREQFKSHSRYIQCTYIDDVIVALWHYRKKKTRIFIYKIDVGGDAVQHEPC